MVETSQYSAPIILLIEFSLALLLALYLLYKYANLRKQNPLVTGCTLLVWFLSFVIISLLPVDVSSAFYQLCLTNEDAGWKATSANSSTLVTCDDYVCHKPRPLDLVDILSNDSGACSGCTQPYTFVCPVPLNILWYIIYWLFFFLSWIVLPLGQSYVLASYFSIWKKFLRALIENALFYVTFLIIFIILFIYLVVVAQIIAFRKLPSLLATASNTWGLLILTLLLGYGLVEVPRTLWNAARRRYTMNHCYFKAAKLYTDMAEADDKLKEVSERVEQVAQSLHYNDPLRKYVDIIIKKFPEDRQKEFSRGHDDYEDFQSSQDPLTKSSLESLLKKAMKAIRVFNSNRIQWMALTDQTLELEDIQTNSTSPTRQFESSLRPMDGKWYNAALLRKIEWYWKLWVLPWAYRMGAVLLGILSVIIVWCEMTFGIHISDKVRLSVFAAVIYALHDYGNYVPIEGISIGVVAYLSICAYFTVFRIRIFNLYNLAPHHSTDEYSLLFSAMLLSRLALPICLNYLYMIQVVELEQHEDNNTFTPQTAFAFATGNTELIPWLTSYFYIYYPMLIVLVCIATIFSVGSRLVSLLGYQKFIGEDDFSADYIDEGKTLMKRERRLRERTLRDHGKKANRDQLPFELLRESHSSSSRRGIDQFALRRAERNPGGSTRQSSLHEEEKSRMGHFVDSVKGFASRGKNAISSKVSFSRKKDDDVVELLAASDGGSGGSGRSSSSASASIATRPSNNNGAASSSGAGGSGQVYRGTGSRDPPKDIFGDI